jgi:hypothetical protein
MVCISKQHFERALNNEVLKSDKPFTDTLYFLPLLGRSIGFLSGNLYRWRSERPHVGGYATFYSVAVVYTMQKLEVCYT